MKIKNLKYKYTFERKSFGFHVLSKIMLAITMGTIYNDRSRLEQPDSKNYDNLNLEK